MSESNERHGLILTSFAIAALTLVARLLGGLLQIVLASRFGASAQLDAYFVAISLPTLVSEWFIIAAPSVALVPLLAELHREGADEEAWKLVISFGNALMLVVVMLVIVAFTAAGPVTRLLAPGLDVAVRPLAASLFGTAALVLLPALGSGVLRAVLYARERFLAPVVATAVSTASAIVAVMLLEPAMGVHSIVLGLILGGIAALLVSAAAARGLVHPWRPLIEVRGALARRSGSLFLAFLIIGTAAQVNSLSDRFFASLLAAGSISIFQYAEKLASFFMMAFAGAVAVPAYTAFSKDVAARDMGELRARVGTSTRLVAVVTLPVLAVSVALRRPIVGLLLEHGAMTAPDARAISVVFALLSLAWAIYAFAQVLTYAFFSLQETRRMIVVIIAGIVVNIALDAVLVRPLGVPGLAIATATAAAASNAILWGMLSRRLGGFSASGVARYALRVVVSAFAAGVAAWLVLRLLAGGVEESLLARTVAVLVPLAAAVAVYLAACRILGVEEIGHIRDAAVHRLRRRADARRA